MYKISKNDLLFICKCLSILLHNLLINVVFPLPFIPYIISFSLILMEIFIFSDNTCVLVINYLSTSPNTISKVPIIVTKSAIICPLDILFNACK